MIKDPNIEAVYESCFTRLFRKTDHEGPYLPGILSIKLPRV